MTMSRLRDSGMRINQSFVSGKFALFQFIAGLLFAAGFSCLALAAPNPLRTRLIPEIRVVETQGKETRARMIPATIIAQGTEVYYTVRATNDSNEKLRNAVIVQAVPVNTRYVDRSATGAGAAITYSIDGGKNFISASELRSAIGDNPKSVRVTHIRWQLRHALAPHVTVFARFRAVFD
jgi:uncharacterized repeat protein (TIGR01451 family)